MCKKFPVVPQVGGRVAAAICHYLLSICDTNILSHLSVVRCLPASHRPPFYFLSFISFCSVVLEGKVCCYILSAVVVFIQNSEFVI